MKRLAGMLLLLFILAPSRAAADDKFSAGGYIRNYSVALRMPELQSGPLASRQPLLGISDSRLRLNLSVAATDKVSLKIAYDLSPRIQDPVFFRTSPFGLSIHSEGYRIVDFRNPLVPRQPDLPGQPYPVDSFGLYHNLDRLNITVKAGIGDWIIGRQPVAWGSARFINPTDVIAPFTYNELDKEERYGVDAVRLRMPLGTLSEMDAGYIFGEDFDFGQSAFFARTKVHIAKTDLALLLLGFRRDLLLGIDLARSLRGAGVWLEGSCVFPAALDSSGSGEGGRYVRLSAGADGSLSAKTYAFLEYHFNSPGASRPALYPELLSKPAYTRGSVYLLGKHYLAAGLNHQITPLVQVTGMMISNIADASFSLSPQAEYNVAKNIYLAAGAYLGIGKAPGMLLNAGPAARLVPRSEFGSYPDFAFLSFRLYF